MHSELNRRPDDSEAASWSEIYAARFGRRLDQRDVAIMEAELAIDLKGGLRPGELTAAIRTIAEDRRKEGATGKWAPTLEALLSRIVRTRYETAKQREQTEGATQTGCALCRKGWVEVIAGIRAKPATVAPLTAPGACVPCLCTVGQKMATASPDYANATPGRYQHLQALARLGHQQAAWRSELYAQDPVAMEARARYDNTVAAREAADQAAGVGEKWTRSAAA